jgi:hypothetical protein
MTGLKTGGPTLTIQGDVMTISVRKELSLDLMRNPNWPLFSRRREFGADRMPIAAYTLAWRSTDADTDGLFRVAAKDVEHRIARVVEAWGCVVQIFVVHQTLQPRAATVLHHKMWKLGQVGPIPSGVQCGAEKLIECGERVRFASVATVPLGAVPWMMSVARKFDLVVPLLLRTPLPLDDVTASDLANIGLPPDGCLKSSDFDWVAFVHHISSCGGICIRHSLHRPDDELSVDFFGSSGEVSALARVLEGDD